MAAALSRTPLLAQGEPSQITFGDTRSISFLATHSDAPSVEVVVAPLVAHVGGAPVLAAAAANRPPT